MKLKCCGPLENSSPAFPRITPMFLLIRHKSAVGDILVCVLDNEVPTEKVNKGALGSSLAQHIEFCVVTLLDSFLHAHRWSSLYSSGEFACQVEAVKSKNIIIFAKNIKVT